MINKKYITIDDIVINRKDKYIGTVIKKEGISNQYNNDVKYSIRVDVSKTYITFNRSIINGIILFSLIDNKEPLNAINMYNKTYFRPTYNYMNIVDARCYDEVKIIDNDYVERLLDKFNYEHQSFLIESHPSIHIGDNTILIPLFTMRFYIQKINYSKNELTCVSVTDCGKKFKGVIPIKCIEFVKKNNIFKRFLLKQKYKKI